MAGIQTYILEGAAHALTASAERPVMGGLVRAATVSIHSPIAYRQWSDWCMLHVTLERSFAPAEGRRGGVGPGDRPGAVSFVPATFQHDGAARCGTIVGLEIGLDPEIIDELCEQRLSGAWRASRDVQDPRALLIAQAIVREIALGHEPIVTDMMIVMLARHLGRRHGGAEARYDDAWLHPVALRRVIERIQAAPADPPRLAELAKISGLGVSAFLRSFRGSTGITPAAYSRQVRIELARRLIETRDLPLREVAAMTGFASPSHLVSSFRSQLGSTPADWRRAVRNITKSA